MTDTRINHKPTDRRDPPTVKADFSYSEEDQAEQKKLIEQRLEKHWRKFGGDKPRHLQDTFDKHLSKRQNTGANNIGIGYAVAGAIFDKLQRALRPNASSPEDIQLVQDYTKALLLWAGEKEDNYNLLVAGTGRDGVVFWLSNKSIVMKITSNSEDAYAAQIISKKPGKDLYKVYKVCRLSRNGYAILGEKLQPLSGSEDHLWESVYKELIGMRKHPAYNDKGMTTLWLKQVREEVEKEAWIFPGLSEKLPQIARWVEEFTSRGIYIQDFHPGNIMMRRHTPIIPDLGNSRVVGAPSIKSLSI